MVADEMKIGWNGTEWNRMDGRQLHFFQKWILFCISQFLMESELYNLFSKISKKEGDVV
jgi:hypothetical protein